MLNIDINDNHCMCRASGTGKEISMELGAAVFAVSFQVLSSLPESEIDHAHTDIMLRLLSALHKAREKVCESETGD